MSIRALTILMTLLPLALSADDERGTIPFDKLTDADAARVQAVVKHRSFKRELKKVEFTGTSELYAFLLDRMPFAADAVRALDIENYRVRDNEDGSYTADDGAGATGTFEIVYSSEGKKVFYALGQYDGKVLNMRGRAVAVVEFEEAEGQKMQNWVSLYFKFDSLVLNSVVKVISLLIGPLIDKKIQYFLDATRTLCKMMVEDPQKAYARLEKAKEMDKKALKEFHKQFVNGLVSPTDKEAARKPAGTLVRPRADSQSLAGGSR
ncbi:MAG: hypothetical protein O3B01_13465 [Planctomycetota bacterium]|nr:hypothetical protein [Planctomycetota bacterium]MDA1139582.1 hypothetical protein [Planctomycetota bacterium]